jgi:hypothetical protein
MFHPRFAALLWAATLIVAPVARASEGDGEPAAPQPQPLTDYQGRGTIQVTIPGANLTVGFNQAYVAPDAWLFAFEMDVLRQTTLMVGDREKTYNAGAAYAVNKQYKNLHQLSSSPSLAAQMSMVEIGRMIREIKNVQVLGNETVLGQECEIVRFSNRDLTGSLLTRGLIGEAGASYVEKGMTKAWVTRAHGLPIQLQIWSNEGQPAILISFSELKINKGLRSNELRVQVPPSVTWISATADVSVPHWEEIAEKEVQKQLAVTQKSQANALRQSQPQAIDPSAYMVPSPGALGLSNTAAEPKGTGKPRGGEKPGAKSTEKAGAKRGR